MQALLTFARNKQHKQKQKLFALSNKIAFKSLLTSRTIMATSPMARLLSETSHVLPSKLKVTEMLFEVPLDYVCPTGEKIQLFGRSCVKHNKPVGTNEEEPKDKKRWLVYLQGGPGFGCPSPEAFPATNYLLSKGYKLLFLDQRGTGLSTPISALTLQGRGEVQEQVEFLKCFRADNIVRDFEQVRRVLTKDYSSEESQKWSILGQSFGGFCAVTYLSMFPQGLKEVFITGGLPPLVNDPDEVYRRTYRQVSKRNTAYYSKYPEDISRVQVITKHLEEVKTCLPSSGVLTPEKFLGMGIAFGAHGGLDSVHDVVLAASTTLSMFGVLTRPVLSKIERMLSFDDAIIYAILHEAIYCQGQSSNWSADRLMKSEYKEFSYKRDGALPSEERSHLFRGEMIYPQLFTDSPELSPLKATADALAQTTDWPKLYDVEQLSRNDVPVYAATYMEDMYVDFEFAQETAANIRGCKQFITNRLYHSALRSRTEEVMAGLFDLRGDCID